MATIKVTNVGTTVIGFDVENTQYTLPAGDSQNFSSLLEEQVQAAIAPFGALLTLEYVGDGSIEGSVFVSADLVLGTDFASGVQFAVAHGLPVTPTDITLSIVAEGDTPAGSIAMTNHADSAGTPSQSSGASAVLAAPPAISVNAAATAALTMDSYTPAGTITGKLNLAVPAFSGTGFTTVGQVITTTDNQTMPAVDTAAGYWFVADGLPAVAPVLVLSNTIVAGAPAVLTVQGIAPVTDAGTYKIITLGAATFTGTPATLTGSVAVTDATYTSDSPAITVTQAAYNALGTHSHANTAAFTGSAEATTLVQSAAADATNVYVTATTSATVLKIKVIAI